MRDCAKIATQFWIGQTGRQIKRLGIKAQLTALYLMTNPHSTLSGIYYLPLILIVHEAGISIKGVSKAIQSLCDIGFCSYEEHFEYVSIHQIDFFQGDDTHDTD